MAVNEAPRRNEFFDVQKARQFLQAPFFETISGSPSVSGLRLRAAEAILEAATATILWERQRVTDAYMDALITADEQHGSRGGPNDDYEVSPIHCRTSTWPQWFNFGHIRAMVVVLHLGRLLVI
jgi:hypothetical protein